MYYIVALNLTTKREQKLDGFTTMIEAIKAFPGYVMAYGRNYKIDIKEDVCWTRLF